MNAKGELGVGPPGGPCRGRLPTGACSRPSWYLPAPSLPRQRQWQSYMKHTATTSYTPKNDPSGIVSLKAPPPHPFKSVLLPDLLSSAEARSVKDRQTQKEEVQQLILIYLAVVRLRFAIAVGGLASLRLAVARKQTGVTCCTGARHVGHK